MSIVDGDELQRLFQRQLTEIRMRERAVRFLSPKTRDRFREMVRAVVKQPQQLGGWRGLPLGPGFPRRPRCDGNALAPEDRREAEPPPDAPHPPAAAQLHLSRPGRVAEKRVIAEDQMSYL